MINSYESFLASKRMVAESSGFDPHGASLHPALYDFQADIVRWGLKRGRAAVFADCGLGKSFIQVEWARQIMRQTQAPVLIVAPLSVAEQTMREARKIGQYIGFAEGIEDIADVCITNYEKLWHFIGAPVAGIVLDESSILKSIDGETRTLLLEKFTTIPYRLCCTATPCPNDVAELANHAQFLGIMKREEMLASFFVHDEDGWRLRGHAAKPFYRWLASWSMALKSPADLGYDGSRFILPPLHIHDEIVETEWRRDGHLFAGGLKGITDRIAVRRQSIPDRIQRAAELANRAEGQVIVWCGLNEESEAVAQLIPDCVEISGNDAPSMKVSKILSFIEGDKRVMVTKIRIAGYGMNFQVASTMIFLGLGDSWEQYYQGIRRCWRYGQQHPVHVYIVVTDHEFEIVDNVRHKKIEAENLSREIITAAREYEMEELGKVRQHAEDITTREYRGKAWMLYQADCVEAMQRMETDSVDLSVFSPPFLSLYVYSESERDLGNSKSPEEFFSHFRFVIQELLRITKPGRNVCAHVSQIPLTLVNHGVIGLSDFRGRTIEAFRDGGWIYHGDICIDKDPQAQAIRTHAKGLMFTQLKKDSSWLRPALADYILVFRKPGENALPIHPDISNDEWIEWARPVWYGIRESDTLNVAEARSDEDDRHVCPLQLGTIERCVRLWSNRGETVFSPFAGIGSEGYVAVQQGRRFIGVELKPLYARTAARNLAEAERQVGQQQTLFQTGID
jgi:DNA modification methylase